MSATAAAQGEEPRTLAPFGRRLATVVEVSDHGAYRMLWAHDAEGPASPHPGQFYMLAAAAGWGSADGRPYLPRAFSYARVKSAVAAGAVGGGTSAGGTADGADGDEGRAPRSPRLGFMLDRVGPGTERLGELAPGEGLWVAGPFGLGFRPPERAADALLVGGGIGVAPILALADRLDAAAARVLLGFRSARHAEVAELFATPAALATDDGSRGRRALVTDLLRDELDHRPAAVVYACGPPPMLEAVRALCQARGVPAQLALESGMACGYGACFGCVVPTRDGFVRLCVDGPVVDGTRLETALFPGAGH